MLMFIVLGTDTVLYFGLWQCVVLLFTIIYIILRVYCTLLSIFYAPSISNCVATIDGL